MPDWNSRIKSLLSAVCSIFLICACNTGRGKGVDDTFFELYQNSYNVDADGGVVEVKLYTNQDYHFDILDVWITEVAAPSKESSIKTHRLKVESNPYQEERIGTVTVCTDTQCIPILLKQEASQGNNLGKDDNAGSGNNTGGSDSGDITDNEDEEWTNSDFVHRSLAIRTTADWCGYCPNMGAAFKYAQERMPGSFEILALHGYNSTYYFAGTNAVFDPYPQNGYPTGVVDGRARIKNEEPSYYPGILSMNVAQETESSYPTVTGIEVNSSLEGQSVKVTVSIFIKKAGSYKVTVLLLEDDIIGYQNNHDGGVDDYEHDNIARLSLSSAYGDFVETVSDNTKWTKSYTGTVPYGCRNDNLKILVFVQKPYGDQTRVEKIYGVEYGICGDWYIDNCRAVKLGDDASLELKN